MKDYESIERVYFIIAVSLIVIILDYNCSIKQIIFYSFQANIVTKELKIPQKLHSSMIGPGGKLILSITAECGDVNIRFPQDGAKSDIITIRGTAEDVEKAEVFYYSLYYSPFYRKH